MRLALSFVLLAAAIGLTPPALAQQTPAEKAHLLCLAIQDIDQRIDACSTAITWPGLDSKLLSDAYTVRGTMHYLRGDFSEAKADLNRAIEIDPSRRVEETKQAIALATAAEKSESALSPTAAMKACKNWRDPERRLRACDRFVQAMSSSDKERSIALALRGAAESRLGREGPSLRDFDEALRLTPGDRVIEEGRANALWRLGRYSEAKAEMDRLIATGSDRSMWARQLALSAYMAGDPESAATMIEQTGKGSTISQFYAAVIRAELQPQRQKDLFKIYTPLSDGPLAQVSVLYRLGEASEAQLLNVINALPPHSRDNAMCQGHFNIGQKSALAGSRAKAIIELEAALTKCERGTFEYDLGKIWLQRLRTY
jgi:tetratricopeptide (TPR) repeat protein